MSDDDFLEPEIRDDLPADEVEDAEPDNAADPRKTERKAKRLQRERREGDAWWRAVFASDVGRREMWAILAAGHCFEERFACGPNGFPQPEATWFAAGQQAFTQRLLFSWQIKDFEGVHVMLCENDPRFAAAKLRAAKANA